MAETRFDIDLKNTGMDEIRSAMILILRALLAGTADFMVAVSVSRPD